jgi:hypothetical protein
MPALSASPIGGAVVVGGGGAYTARNAYVVVAFATFAAAKSVLSLRVGETSVADGA